MHYSGKEIQHIFKTDAGTPLVLNSQDEGDTWYIKIGVEEFRNFTDVLSKAGLVIRETRDMDEVAHHLREAVTVMTDHDRGDLSNRSIKWSTLGNPVLRAYKIITGKKFKG